jgi:hypothetical protein
LAQLVLVQFQMAVVQVLLMCAQVRVLFQEEEGCLVAAQSSEI